jgi:membrane fusion protein (multidrug efflux system)
MGGASDVAGGQEIQAQSKAPRTGGRKRWLLALLLVALLAAAWWLAQWWTTGRFIENTNDAYLRADNMTVAPKVSGYVVQVLVGDNQAVDAGQPLLQLDDRQYRAALDQALASVDARRADIARAEADVLQQRSGIAQAQAQRQGARASLDYASAEVQRYAPLALSGADTAERLAQLRNARAQAGATLAADAAAVQVAQRQVAASRAQIQQARAQLEAAEASARQARLDLQDTVVRSALAGRIGDRTVRVGQYVQPGTRTMTVVPVNDVYLVANFKETQVGAMRSGQSATIHVDALPGAPLHGVVESFAPGTGAQFALLPPENATGNFTKIVQRVPVRIRIDADAATRERLLPGLSVTVDVDTRAPQGARATESRHG